MIWIKKILLFFTLYSFLLSSAPINHGLVINEVEEDQITLTFELSDASNNNPINTPIFNYILELGDELEFEFSYSANSTYQSQEIRKNDFKNGIAKNEVSLINQPIVSVSNQFFLNNKQYIQLTVNPFQYIDQKQIIVDNISITIDNFADLKILNTYEASNLLTRQNHVETPVLLIIAPMEIIYLL